MMRIASWSPTCALIASALVLGAMPLGCGDDLARVTSGRLAAIEDISIPQTQINRSTDVQFRIRNNGDGDLLIHNVELVDASPFIQFADSFIIQMRTQYDWENAASRHSWVTQPAFALGPQREIQVDLSFSPTSQDPGCPSGNPGETCGRVVIETDDRSQRRVEVNLTLNQSAGTIRVDPTVIGFPDVVGGPYTEEFTISNAGTGPLTGVSVVDPGVTGITLSETSNRPEPFTLEIGGQSTYEVTFEPAGGVDYCPDGIAGGCTLGVVTIHSDDATGTVVSVTLAVGNISQPAIGLSRNRIDFTQASVGVPETQTVDVSNSGGANLTWNLRIDPPGVRDVFALEVAGTAIPASGGSAGAPVAPGNAETVAITLDPSSEASITGELVVTSNDPVSPRLGVVLFGGEPAPDIVVEPTQLRFQGVALGDSAELQFVLINQGRATLEIDGGVITGPSAVEFSLDPALEGQLIGPRDRLPVTVIYDRPGDDTSGLDTATLRITSNAPAPNDEYNVFLFADHGATALPPTAEVTRSPDQGSYPTGEAITLDASGSQPPPDGDPEDLSYHWVLADRPTGSEAALSANFGEQVALTPDVAGIYGVLLTVTAIIDDTTQTQAQLLTNIQAVD